MILYYRKFIEKFGRGINLIINDSLEAKQPKPIFEQRSGGVLVTLPFNKPLSPASITTNADIEKEVLLLNLSDLQKELLLIVKKARKASIREIETKLKQKTSPRTIRYNLNKLKLLA
jgi:predicted HTH transcriptional regulator